MKRTLALAVMMTLLPCAVADAENNKLMQQAREQFQPIPVAPPALKGNAITREKWRWARCCSLIPDSHPAI